MDNNVQIYTDNIQQYTEYCYCNNCISFNHKIQNCVVLHTLILTQKIKSGPPSFAFGETTYIQNTSYFLGNLKPGQSLQVKYVTYNVRIHVLREYTVCMYLWWVEYVIPLYNYMYIYTCTCTCYIYNYTLYICTCTCMCVCYIVTHMYIYHMYMYMYIVLYTRQSEVWAWASKNLNFTQFTHE